MCPGWRHLPGRCCGVLIILIFLQLLRLVVSVPAPEGLPSYPADRIYQENPTSQRNIRTRGSRNKLPLLRTPDPVERSSLSSYEGPGSQVYKPHHPVKQSPQSYFSLLRQRATESDPPIPDYFVSDHSKTPFPFPFFDHNFLLNLGIPLLGETSLDSGETQRNTRSAWNTTNHTFRHHRVNFQLYSLKAWTLLQLLPNGTVGLSANESDPHTFLKIQPLQMQQPYTIRLRSVATGIYLCMNRQGSLYSSCNRSSECEFLPRIEKTYYTTIESKQYPKRYIAIGADKRIKRARKQRPGKTLIEEHFFLAYKKNLKTTDLLLRKVFPVEQGPIQHCADFTQTFAKDREILRPSPTTTTPTPYVPKTDHAATPIKTYSGNSVSYSTKIKSERGQSINPQHSKKKKSKKCQESSRRKCRRRKCKSEKCKEKRRKRKRRRKEKMKLITYNQTEDNSTMEDNTNGLHSTRTSNTMGDSTNSFYSIRPSNTMEDNTNDFHSISTSNIKKNNNFKNNVNIKNSNINIDSSVNFKNISIKSSYKNNNLQPSSVSSLKSSQDSRRNGLDYVSTAAPPSHRTRHKHGQQPSRGTKGKKHFYTEAPTVVHNVNRGSSSSPSLARHPSLERSRLANKVVQSTLWSALNPSTVTPFLAPSPIKTQQWSDSFASRSHLKDAFVEQPITTFSPKRNLSTQPPFRATPSSSFLAQPNTTIHTLRHVRRRDRTNRQRTRGRKIDIKR